MIKYFSRMLLAATAIGAPTAVLAEDFTGFVGIDFGPDWQQAHDDNGYDESGPGGWAAVYGRVGVDLADDITAQFDAWFRNGESEIDRPADSYTWQQQQGGAAGDLF